MNISLSLTPKLKTKKPAPLHYPINQTTTISDIINDIGLDDENFIVSLNDELVSKDEYHKTLKNQDRLALIAPITAG